MNHQLKEFISKIRQHAKSNEVGNTLSMSMSVWNKYYAYLEIIQDEYDSICKPYIEGSQLHNNALRAKGPGEFQMTLEEIEKMNELTMMQQRIHLKIESFYIFSKILLDRVADTFAFYFEFEWRGMGSTHVKLCNKFQGFCSEKGLMVIPEGIQKVMITLKDDVVTYRNNNIEHTDEPRLMFGTGWDPMTEKVRIIPNIIYPKAGEAETYYTRATKTPDEIISSIVIYIDNMCLFFESNINNSILQKND